MKRNKSSVRVGERAGYVSSKVTCDMRPFYPQPQNLSVLWFGGKGWPEFLIQPLALAKMHALVDACPLEIGWFFEVDMNDQGDLVVSDVHVPRQSVNSVHFEWDEDADSDLCNSLEIERVERLRGRGHSHVHMSCDPSQEDISDWFEHWQDMSEGNYRAFIIANKKGDITCHLAVGQILVNNLAWGIPSSGYAVSSDIKKWANSQISQNIVLLPEPQTVPPHSGKPKKKKKKKGET